ncbi:MAG: hypothetical protein Q9226_005917 [Calogaya cf. arnoldii]
MEAYADTPKEVLETIDYLDQLTHQVVLPPDDNTQCPICLEPFITSDQITVVEGQVHYPPEIELPVSLPCGHILGFRCLQRYLSPFGEARNSCPMCRRKLFEAPYKPDTVTKLRARLEAFDNYFRQLPHHARPDQTERLRELLWQYSRTTMIEPAEERDAELEARTAVLNYDRDSRGIPRRAANRAEAIRHTELREQMLRLRQQAHSLERAHERVRNQAIEHSRLQREREATLVARARLGRESYRDQVNQSARARQQPQAAMRIDLSAPGDQEGQIQGLPNEARQPTRSVEEGSDENDSEAQGYRTSQGQQQLRRSSWHRLLIQQEIQQERVQNAARQPVRETPPPRTELNLRMIAQSRAAQAAIMQAQNQQRAATQRQLPPPAFYHHPFTHAPTSQQDAAQTTAQPEGPIAREQRLNTLKRSLDEREAALNGRDANLDVRERNLAHRERLLASRDRVYAARLPKLKDLKYGRGNNRPVFTLMIKTEADVEQNQELLKW